MIPVKLETLKLQSKTVVRPAGQLGTCGFRPKAWTAVYVGINETPVMAFIRVNKNWTIHEVYYCG